MKFFNNTETTYTYWVATALAKQTRALVPDEVRGAGYHKYTDTCNFMTVCAGEWNGMGSVTLDAWTADQPTLFKTKIEAEAMVKALKPAAFEFDLISGTVKFHRIIRHSKVTFDIKEEA